MLPKLRSFIGVLVVYFSSFTLSAYAQGLDLDLKAYKVIVVEGAETFVSADVAAPGDLVEYRATYRNLGKEPLKDVRPEIPVPPGLILVPGAELPAAESALVLGRGYVALPALDQDAKPVAAKRLRALRWKAESLPAGATREVKLRVLVGLQ